MSGARGVEAGVVAGPIILFSFSPLLFSNGHYSTLNRNIAPRLTMCFEKLVPSWWHCLWKFEVHELAGESTSLGFEVESLAYFSLLSLLSACG